MKIVKKMFRIYKKQRFVLHFLNLIFKNTNLFFTPKFYIRIRKTTYIVINNLIV